MWMMGCSSDVSESFTRRVRSHIPRPSTILNPSPYMSRRGDHLVLNHHNHLVSAAEQSKRDFDEEEPALVSSRWNPTPEQIQTLEELYRRGTRTPSADQIIHITAQLRRFGRIEGKNVFYWFQNHKARERSKRRRRFENIDDHQDLPQTTLQESQGASRTSHEANEEAAKNNIYWGFSTITATPTEEESVSMQNAERSEGIQYDHQVQQNTWFMNRYPTWQMMPSSTSSSSSSSSSTRPIFTMVTEDLNLLLNNQKQAESHTLELFPIQKGDKNGENMDDLKGKSVCNEESCGSSPKQFFEFL